MGTGVGEAMLLGAAMGGGSAAITGGDPLKGALIGGLTGGAGSGIAGGLPALAPEAAATTLASTTPTALSALAPEAAATTLASTTAPAAQAGIPSLLGENAAFIANNPSLYPAGFANPNTATLLTPSGTPYAIPSAASNVVPSTTGGTFTEGMAKFAKSPMASLKANPFTAAGSGLAGAIGGREELTAPEEYDGPLKRFRFNPETYRPAMFAEGGIATLDSGGYDRMVGEQPMYMSNMASGGISDLGSYSDGGRMLRGPGDGMSDSIPASIAGKRPARLATEEFVIPADVVSHLGNGSSDAGAKQLYAMMERVRKARTGRSLKVVRLDPKNTWPHKEPL
jgi:hypothetical protein